MVPVKRLSPKAKSKLLLLTVVAAAKLKAFNFAAATTVSSNNLDLAFGDSRFTGTINLDIGGQIVTPNNLAVLSFISNASYALATDVFTFTGQLQFSRDSIVLGDNTTTLANVAGTSVVTISYDVTDTSNNQVLVTGATVNLIWTLPTLTFTTQATDFEVQVDQISFGATTTPLTQDYVIDGVANFHRPDASVSAQSFSSTATTLQGNVAFDFSAITLFPSADVGSSNYSISDGADSDSFVGQGSFDFNATDPAQATTASADRIDLRVDNLIQGQIDNIQFNSDIFQSGVLSSEVHLTA